MTLLVGIYYNRVYLLTNNAFERSKGFYIWLEAKTGYASSDVDLYQVDLSNSIH